MRKSQPIFTTSLLALLLLVLATSGAHALPPVNADERGVAVRGYDVVAYFTVGEPVAGSSEFSFRWKGAAWWFSSREHLELFQGNPEKYTPQYGGY
jgi:YHS domain-containing protein